ncbi:hypothetical protein GCM10007304_10520 [Rhodococcoides trifolii]|uniref:Uncharacterized protein n=1 Tax=Rhodococcoides trifolii TaxID=908250 RepID=A0A917FPW9_9NOCA|nr:hypothetical protein [Rhodococcus trifolii]GGF98397.1 hypothetical protein GCM10007304_10520 [Rhodococcus trifolii]
MSGDRDQVSLSEEATAQCVAACDQYVTGLQSIADATRYMVKAESFGTLPSGQALGKKFFDLASGSNQSFEQVIQQHIDVIQRLREVFVQAGAGYQAAEDSNTALLENSIK